MPASNVPSGIPPLIGDGKGGYRIHILGISGSGKTTLASQLSEILGIPQISIDEVFWQPNWTETPIEEFKVKLAQALKQAEAASQRPQGVESEIPESISERQELLQTQNSGHYTGWVVDGNYFRRGSLLATERATDIIWLDPPFIVSFWRVFKRTIRRIFGYNKPCSPGCGEDFRLVFFSRDSIFLDCIGQVSVVRTRCEELMKTIGTPSTGDSDVTDNPRSWDGVEGISTSRRMRRIGGWGGELSQWVQSVREMVLLDQKKA